MHSRFKQVLVVSLACASFNISAIEANYAGAMYKYRHMPGRHKESFNTENVLPRFYNGAEIFFAHRFESDVGVHIGYEQSKNETVNYRFGPNELFIGPAQSSGNVSDISTRIRAVQFDMVGYINYLERLELIGQFGFAMLEADMHGTLYSGGVANNLAPSRGFKPIPRIGIGMHYFFVPNKFGFRLFGDWEATNLFRMQMTDEDGVRQTIRPFRQSRCITAGLVMKIMG